jgi:hypothetical protein
MYLFTYPIQNAVLSLWTFVCMYLLSQIDIKFLKGKRDYSTDILYS